MFIDKLLSLAVGLLFLLVLSCDGPAGEAETKAAALTTPRTLENEPAFWDYAASSNLLQTSIGQLAIERGDTQQVRALAEEAVGFHGNALMQLKKLANKYTLVLPDSLTGADRDLVKEFEQLEGEEFNARYRAFVSSTHQMQLSHYEEALQKTEDQEIREWLKALLEHLRVEQAQLNAPDSLQQPVL